MMKKAILTAVLTAGMLITSAPAFAGPIESACMKSGRKAANRALCNCVQQVADQTLKSSDQRRAAKFFRDPDLAHTTWVSQRASDDAFWERYKSFGQMAEVYCGG